MEKQRGMRDVRSEFSNDDGSSLLLLLLLLQFSSVLSVREIRRIDRSHRSIVRMCLSFLRNQPFREYMTTRFFLSFFLQTAGVRTARSARIRTSGTGGRKERVTGAASGTRGDDKLDVYYYKWYQQTKRNPKAAATTTATTATTTTESRRSARENDKQSRPTSV